MPSGSQRQNHMRGGRVECATRHRWGEDPGEDKAHERIGHPSPSPAVDGARIHRSLKTLKVTRLAGQHHEGMTSREVFGDRWGKTSEGLEPHERYRSETDPSGFRGEQSVERLRKPEDATRQGRHPCRQVALRFLKR
jgi:hypothetical protein